MSLPEGRATCKEAKIMFKKIVLMVAVMALAAPVLLTGCNTVEGAGKDIKKVGGEIQEEAAKHTDKD